MGSTTTQRASGRPRSASRRRRFLLSAAIVAAGVLTALAATPGFDPDLATLEADRAMPVTVFDNGAGRELPALLDAATVPVVDGGWVPFDWHGEPGKVVYVDDPITFHTDVPVTLRITDDFCSGDVFRLYDNDVEVGETFRLHGAIALPSIGPEAAFAAREFSSGIFSLPAGEHELSIHVIDNHWGMGRAYLRIDTEHPFASFVTGEVASTYGKEHDNDRFHFQAAYMPGAGTDGTDFAVEDVVLWYGRHLEVVPGGSFVCTSQGCLYESAGPGITRAWITGVGMAFEARGVDLCPGGNPLEIGVWMGDEGGTAKVRCCGSLHD